ncbi:HAD hydrolase-like protein [Pseudonocardia asaccharolytica]|uniref:Haloacid dehalogenase n=1 Tax=Pseudonocardia asaccharolytica DSM 44247 = NBRC 16224 TaxID=1123024 RepID=A0A511D2L5_9PSEU|nr:HAD hydrolase-like protein [Pseudonocardia asaccharolytica]GEL17148.1 haloacid dehalogenase [Pseudonocardia asaccharolytica DSM 44247 = NBRC 16224]
MSDFDTVLLDLDGTLVDSAAGIFGSLRDAFDELGVPWPEDSVGPAILGPPLHETLPSIIGAEATRAVMQAYRRRYAEEGLHRSIPYPGIAELLHELAGRGARLALATSKAEVHARVILENLGWSDLFAEIVGDTLDAGLPTKAAVIAEALARLGGHDGAVMIGDRRTDVVGARAHGIDCLGAGWGYGEPDELAAAGAVAIVESPAALGPMLIR